MSKFSDKFKEIWTTESRATDMQQYEFCLNEWKSNHESKMIFSYIITIALFGLGMWALSEQMVFLTVFLLALAANYNAKSNQHIFMSEAMDSQRLLAMLVNKQSEEINKLRETINNN